MVWFIKLAPIVVAIAVLVWVVFNIEPPRSVTSASPLQLAFILIPLYALFVLLANLYFHSFLKSSITAFGMILLLFLKALDALNLVSVTMTAASVYLILRSLKKNPVDSQPDNIRRLTK